MFKKALYRFSAAKEATLYEKLGGKPAISLAVDKFYVKMMADPLTNTFFKGVDMVKQREKQTKFLTVLTGGPNEYTWRDMKSGHAGMGIKDVHFDRTKLHLITVLQELGVAQNLVNDVGGAFESFRKQVVE